MAPESEAANCWSGSESEDDGASSGDISVERSSELGTPGSQIGFARQAALVLAVVALGCANNVSKQIATRPLRRFSYMLTLSTAVAYVPIYGGVLLALLRARVVPRSQLAFVWTAGHRLRYVWYFALASLGDTLGDSIAMICTPYLSGPVNSLIGNCTTMFVAMLSVCVLHSRYSLLQCIALVGVALAVYLGILPSLQHQGSMDAQPFFAIVSAGSCIFNAMGFVIKEWLFRRYLAWAAEENEPVEDGGGDGKGLHVFVVNTHTSLFMLPLMLLTVPLNQALGQTDGAGIASYMSEAFSCVFGSPSACGEGSHGAQWASICVVIYVVFNILWNVSILLSVKHSGALATFVALKAIFPVSTVLFASVDWPLLGKSSLSWLIWASVAVVLPSIAVYQWASTQQNERASSEPSEATCCWPLGVEKRRRNLKGQV